MEINQSTLIKIRRFSQPKICCHISKKYGNWSSLFIVIPLFILYYWASRPVRKSRDIFGNPIINFLRSIVTIFIRLYTPTGDVWRSTFGNLIIEIITIHFTNVIVTTLLKQVPIKECKQNTEATIKITA